MGRFPRYLWYVVAYMAMLIAASTFATIWFCDLDAVDSFYFVVQTLWTVGYGDIVLPGTEGRVITIAIILLGTVGITSALGVVGGMILDSHAVRRRRLEAELEKIRKDKLEALYHWAEKKGIDRETVNRALEEVRDEQG